MARKYVHPTDMTTEQITNALYRLNRNSMTATQLERGKELAHELHARLDDIARETVGVCVAAVNALQTKMNWSGQMISGGFGNDLYFVAVPAKESFRGGSMIRDAIKHDTFVEAYIEAMFFTNGSSSEDELYELGIDDISFYLAKSILRDCAIFQAACFDQIDGSYKEAGHDFWLTRNGHGAGFWDGDWNKQHGIHLTEVSEAFGECEVYKGDDSLIYS